MRILFLLLLISCSSAPYFQVEKSPPGDKKFCFIGDMGDASEAQKQVATLLAAENCHEIFVLGDVIYEDGIKSSSDPLFEERFLKLYRPIAESGHHPRFSIILGNHDHNGNAAAWLELAKQHPWIYFPHFYYIRRQNDLCFIALDSSWFTLEHFSWNALRQWRWLKKNKKKLEDCSATIALAHHPYRAPKKRKAAIGLLKDFYEDDVIGNFHFLITGHDHSLADLGEVEGTRLLVSGAGGQFENEKGFLVLQYGQRDGQERLIEMAFRKVE